MNLDNHDNILNRILHIFPYRQSRIIWLCLYTNVNKSPGLLSGYPYQFLFYQAPWSYLYVFLPIFQWHHGVYAKKSAVYVFLYLWYTVSTKSKYTLVSKAFTQKQGALEEKNWVRHTHHGVGPNLTKPHFKIPLNFEIRLGKEWSPSGPPQFWVLGSTKAYIFF